MDQKSLLRQVLLMALLKGGTAEAAVEAEIRAFPVPNLDQGLQKEGKVKVTLHQVDQNPVVLPEVVAIPLQENTIMARTKALKDMCMERVLTTNTTHIREDLVAEVPPLPIADHVKVQKLGSTRRKATTIMSDGGNVPAPMKGRATEAMTEITLGTAITEDEC